MPLCAAGACGLCASPGVLCAAAGTVGSGALGSVGTDL